jgi:PKD repeat protein/N-acetylmuramoyl-L-alanine amidase
MTATSFRRNATRARVAAAVTLTSLATLLAVATPGQASGESYTVCLDPGHTLDRDPGAVARASFGADKFELREVDINLDVAHALRDVLTARGLTVVMTWDGAGAGWPQVGAPDDAPAPVISSDPKAHDPEGLEARGRRCVNAGADAMFSVHHNALEEPGDGLVTLFRDPGSGQRDRDRAVANAVHETMWEALGRSKPARPFTDFGLFFEDWGVARGAIGIPTVILEPVVMTDPHEARLLTPTTAQGGARRQRIVQAEASAILAARAAVFDVARTGPRIDSPPRPAGAHTSQATGAASLSDSLLRLSARSGTAPLRVDFSSSVERAFLFAWSFGDGAFADSQHVSHLYERPGLYVVRFAACTRSSIFQCSEATATVNVVADESAESGKLAAMEPAHAAIDRPGDADEWRFPASTGDVVTISMAAGEASPLDTVLRLVGPDGGLVAFNDDSGEGTDSRLEAVQLPLGGEYVIEASGFGDSEGPYALVLEVVGADQVHAALSAQPATAVAPAEVIFTNESRNATSFSWEFGDGATSNERSPSHRFEAAGSLPVTLTACRAGDCSTATVNVVLEEGDGGALPAASPALGRIDFEDDVDTWVFQAPQGAEVTVSLVSLDDGFDPLLFLRGPDGAELVSNDDGGEGVNARIANFILPVGGELAVDTLGFPGSGVGPYELTATVEPEPMIRPVVEVSPGALVAPAVVTFADASLGGPLSSSWDFGDGARGTGREVLHRFERPGEFVVRLRSCNARSCADWRVQLRIREEADGGSILLNETAFGAIDQEGDSDDWVLAGEAGQVITAAVIADELGFDPILDVIGPDGGLLASDDDSGGDLQPLLRSIELPARGDYTLRVSGVGEGAQGSYRIELSAR